MLNLIKKHIGHTHFSAVADPGFWKGGGGETSDQGYTMGLGMGSVHAPPNKNAFLFRNCAF